MAEVAGRTAAGSRGRILLFIGDLQADAVGGVEAADRAASRLAKGQVDGAVDPDLAVVVHRGLEPDRPAAEVLAADPVGNGDLDAVPGKGILAGTAAFLEGFRLDHLPLGIVERAVGLRFDLVLFRAHAGLDEVKAPLSLNLGHPLAGGQVDLADQAVLGCVLGGRRQGGQPGHDQRAGRHQQADRLTPLPRHGCVLPVVKKKRDPRPGDEIQIAVLGVNGPIGNPPANKIFLHGFTGLQFYAPDAPKAGENVPAVAAAPEGKEVAKLNLLNPKDVDLLKGQWRFKLIDVHTGPDQNEIEPKAHGAFDDKSWEVLDPATLGKARGPGNFSMAWYRLAVTLPEKVGDTSVAGTAAWFRTTVDDYGEVWVNGKIDLAPGRAGRGAISGFNRLNEVLLTDNVKPGETVQIAVLGINSPWGNPPGNNIFLRPTEIRFYQK